MFLTILILAVSGSLVRGVAQFVLSFAARRSASPAIAGADQRTPAFHPPARVDPVLAVGFILGSYGAISLALLSAFPGDFALERTLLTYSFLGIGGLIGEITKPCWMLSLEANSAETPAPPPARLSRGLSVALMLTLNLAVAVLSAQQGLIEIVPPKTEARAEQLEPIEVVARRPSDPLEHPSAMF